MSLHVPLWCKSNFSFLEGASHPGELVTEAHRLGLQSIALCDRDGVYGVVRAHEKAIELGIHLIIGSQVTVDDGSLIVLLAQDRGGYANLCQLLTAGRRRSAKGQSSVTWQEVCEHSAGLLALWGGDRSLLISETPPEKVATQLCDAFGDRLYALIARHRRAEEIDQEIRLREHAKRWSIPVVAGSEVLYHTVARRPLQDVLTCVRHGTALCDAGRLIKPNAEHALKTPHAFAGLFADDSAAVAMTREVAARCTFSLKELHYRYPLERLSEGESPSQCLHRLTFEGARKRYGGDPPVDVVHQLTAELSLIEELDYGGYFLTLKEVVEFCHDQNILCQGRGSAANSAVCYCLGITAVDPTQIDLLFERFLSRERAEPPDIDLDIEHERREEVIQHVYERYGRDKAAMVANVITYRGRSAARDVGKALGYSETEIDRLAKLIDQYEGIDDDAIPRAGLSGSEHLLPLARELYGFPRHLSIHPGGFLLGHEPVATLVPVENATMPDRTVIQWDKNDIESLGLFKVDLLGLGALTHLHQCFDLLRKQEEPDLSIATIPADDKPTYDMICAADTVGVFQIESRAQMSMLPRLNPRTYYDLVIEVSIVRPGPISGGMVHPYLRRRNKQEEVDYPHPSLELVLKKTLGIPLFQEQVIKLAMTAADYTPGEADQLRRDMAAWHRNGRMDQHKERLISRMQGKGIPLEFAERVFKQICGFGEYGFPESHAASFALVSYAGSWLKRHHPAVFACGLLNAQPMGFYTPATIIEDTKRHCGGRRAVEFRAVDVCESRWDCTLEPRSSIKPNEDAFAVRMGFRYVKGFRENDWKRIEAAGSSPFTSIDDFKRRTRLDEGALTALAEIGAFERFRSNRRSALWEVKGLARTTPMPLPLEDAAEQPRFDGLSLLETVNWDYSRGRHSTRAHPLVPLREELRAQRLPDAETVRGMNGGRRVRYAGLVICRQHPGTAAGVTFMTLEDETGFVNLVLWRDIFEKYGVLARTASFLGVTGTIQNADGVTHVMVEKLWEPQLKHTPETAGSRDFH